MSARRGVAIVAGALAARPGIGGHTWVFLQYLLGLRRLGWDVLFLDQIAPELCVDAGGRRCRPEDSWNLRYLRDVMERFGLGSCWALVCGSEYYELPRSTVREQVADAALLLNVMGYFAERDILERASMRVFLDIDPGFGQMWRALSQADIFRGHNFHATIGTNIGQADCLVPACGLDWIATVPPVVLEQWPVQPSARRGGFTTVATWRGPFDAVEFEGRKYGVRAHEFRAFFPLPRASGQRFELALDIHSADAMDRAALQVGGWRLADPADVADDPWSYRAYIQESQAEFMVAKGMYAQSRCGWTSDRSVCYLASGKPVLVQDTGITGLPAVGGLVTFATLQEAIDGAVDIMSDYQRHARAARAIAEERFDSDVVLRTLLTRLGL